MHITKTLISKACPRILRNEVGVLRKQTALLQEGDMALLISGVAAAVLQVELGEFFFQSLGFEESVEPRTRLKFKRIFSS